VSQYGKMLYILTLNIVKFTQIIIDLNKEEPILKTFGVTEEELRGNNMQAYLQLKNSY